MEVTKTITVTMPQPGEEMDYITAQRVSEVFGVKVREKYWDKHLWIIWDNEKSCWRSSGDFSYKFSTIVTARFVLYEEPKLSGEKAKQALLNGKQVKNLRTCRTYYMKKGSVDYTSNKWAAVWTTDGFGVSHTDLLTIFDTDDQWEIVTPAPEY